MKAQLEFQTSGMFTETLQYLDRGGTPEMHEIGGGQSENIGAWD